MMPFCEPKSESEKKFELDYNVIQVPDPFVLPEFEFFTFIEDISGFVASFAKAI